MILIAILSLSTLAISCNKDRYVEFSGFAQGGRYCVKANLKGVRTRPDKIAAQIDTILSEIDRTLSGYYSSSMLSRFNRGETIVPSEMFIDLYEISRSYFDASDGAFDIASAPLFDIWGFGFSKGEMPTDSLVGATLASCGSKHLSRDIRSCLAADGSLTPMDLVIGMRPAPPKLNFNAIAQGYSCDRVALYLDSIGVKDMLVDIGEIFCRGLNPSGQPWAIGIDRPIDGNMSPGSNMQGIWRASGSCGVVTSGNYRKFYVRNGKKYAHTIDPRTGCPVDHSLLSATVIAPDATTADAVATWCMVIGVDSSLAVLRRLGLEGCLLYAADSATIASITTPGFTLEQQK